eukprot:5722-Heterococcus_DN1.PRE.1
MHSPLPPSALRIENGRIQEARALLRPGRVAKREGSSSGSARLAQPTSSTLVNKVWALRHSSPYAGTGRTNLKEKSACKHAPLEMSNNSSYNVAKQQPSSSPTSCLPPVGSASPRFGESTAKSSSPGLEEMLASLDSKHSTAKQHRVSSDSTGGGSFAYSGKVVITLKPDDMKAAVARKYSLTAPKWPRPQVRSSVSGNRTSSNDAGSPAQSRKSPVRAVKPVARSLQLSPLQQSKNTDTLPKAGYDRKDSASTADTSQLSSRSSSSFTDAEPAAAAAVAAASKQVAEASNAQAASSKTAVAADPAKPAQAEQLSSQNAAESTA